MMSRPCIVSRKYHNGKAWVIEDVGPATFHQFGADYEEFSEGFAPFTTAVVEFPNGQVDMVRAERVRFTDVEAP